MAVWLVACANPIAPTGGLKDETPPILVPERSSANYQLHFEKKPLLFTFNEFLKLDKADLQVLVSPPLAQRPEITLKDKTVTFKFDTAEELKPNTTYIINFGEAIKDFTEGNIVPDMHYVFSTGAFLDSLSFIANIFNADDKKPADKTVLMLYRELSDSAIYKILPDYAARTNANGEARLEYLQPGTYQVVALRDENLNYKFDLSNEKAGFLSSPVTLPYDGRWPDIQIFARETPTKIASVDSNQMHRVRINLDPGTEGVRLSGLTPGSIGPVVTYPKYFDIYYADSLRTLDFEMSRPLFPTDTFRMRLSPSRASRHLIFREEKPAIQSLPNIPGQPASFFLNVMMHAIHSDSLILTTFRDSVLLPVTARVDTTDRRRLWVHSNWKADSNYQLILLPGAITTLTGNTNDSLRIDLKVVNPATLGYIDFMIDSLNLEYRYEILLVTGETVYGQWISEGSGSFKARIDNLPANTYEVRIREDRNRNGKIDRGSFDRKEEPEKEYARKLEQLRENWGVETLINMNDFKGTETD